MTLIAGFRCVDGFVIAADTELTLTNIRVQGHKLTKSRLDDPCTFCIAFAGDESYGLAASQAIRDLIISLAPTDFANLKQAISTSLSKFFDDRVLRDWQSIGSMAPAISLIIGIEDRNREFGVLSTDRNCVYEVDHSAFAGSGHEIAAYVCEKWFDAGPLPVAVTEHLAQQVFREVKGKGIYVGGNTEVVSRRCASGAAPFFKLPTLEAEYRSLWGLEDILHSAVRVALSDRFLALPGHEVSGLLETRLNELKKRLINLYSDRHADENVATGDERHLTEFGTEYGNPFKDY